MGDHEQTASAAFSSDLTLNVSSVIGAAPDAVATTNKNLIKLAGTIPKWWEIGAPKYRELRESGQTSIPPPVYLADSTDLSVPSRDAGRSIPVRQILPDGQARGQQPGVFLHIHGGGWTLMHEKSSDPFLKRVANHTGLAVLSAGYRLAPEHPFPAGPNDCYDVAEYLVDHAVQEFGAEMLFVGGESAGAHLSSLVVLHLLHSRPAFRFKGGAVLTYGCYNLSVRFPSSRQLTLPLVLGPDTITAFFDAFVPNRTPEERADPAISPFWHPIFHIDEDSFEGKGTQGLPPALFMCGTVDPFLDDSVFMATKWQMAGAEATLRLFRGCPHGFTLIPDDRMPGSEQSVMLQLEWMKSKMTAKAN